MTASSLSALLPELGQLNRKQYSALVGVAARNCVRAQLRGKRLLSGGRAAVRSALLMAALVAT